eukprot:CAMPEP_0170548396 /NCGR_PEP_ID=MMETSP0211-20121228/6721_1 /TAXON_ID=311385 /ORGANISM="Pseudokeronopsis sp., Strain OXSARD2" /LENGTH=70 /DNA_ID=CAMNT_0010853927 /DNA_START=74 /DNA_END=286 /DNA_ORIENTATION=+
MEDATICRPGFDGAQGLFGVFDGHGGVEVAAFVQRNFEEQLKANQSYKMKNYEMALQDCFLKMDEMLMGP